MVGPGTGISPFRSIIAEQKFAKMETKNLLFFGCRGFTQDFYFQDEWPEYKNTNIFVAFSRDQPKKVKINV